MDSRRDFLKKTALLSGGIAMANLLPPAIQKALAINPAPGSTYLDAEHVVILMQENRSFDHCFGTLQGVRGFNDPRAVRLPNQSPVWLQTDAVGNTYSPFRLDIKDTKITWMGSLPHSRASQVDANNYGKYDKWLIAKKSGNRSYAGMPLTMGHYTRDDLAFNYGMADAFTVCDQNFCSAMTSTTPNRSFFWTGKITDIKDGLPKANIRNTDYTYGNMPWQTFPELLEENGVNWKFYQNDLSTGGGYVGEERAWLGNFGCNLLEFFKAYNVKFSDRYVRNLQKQIDVLPGEISKLQAKSTGGDADKARKIQESIRVKQEVLENARTEFAQWNKDSYNKLSEKEKSMYRRAFTINSGDPDFRTVTQLTYTDNGKERIATIPKGDLLHQFREDVNNGKLPTVSWLAGPQNYSDHPSAPWYGAWYVSEILDILTKNPEVWKKTIFIVTYDENDGYFDHVPPFSIADNNIPGTGKSSAGIESEIEFVRLENELKQGNSRGAAREGAIGLGFRVPMMIASPWSRGGNVCSEVFDHTSTLQFLETFVNKKYNKNLHLANISQWRRTICGNLTSAFMPYNGEKLGNIPFLDRDKKVEEVFNAKFKDEPSFKKLSSKDIERLSADPTLLSMQEKGVRTACALPYELYSEGGLSADKKRFELNFAAANEIFGKSAVGAPFRVYAPVKYNDEVSKDEISRNWHFTVAAGDKLNYSWPVEAFDKGQYNLHVHGPNGFYREFTGDQHNPLLKISCAYERSRLNVVKATGNVVVNIVNNDSKAHTVTINDNAYKTGGINKIIAANSKAQVVLDLQKNFNWYDFSVKVKGNDVFEERFAGRVETGAVTKTDPLMGGVV